MFLINKKYIAVLSVFTLLASCQSDEIYSKECFIKASWKDTSLGHLEISDRVSIVISQIMVDRLENNELRIPVTDDGVLFIGGSCSRISFWSNKLEDDFIVSQALASEFWSLYNRPNERTID